MRKALPADTWQNLFYPPPEYIYFQDSDRFGFEPAARELSWSNAWWLADASLLAYVKDWQRASDILTARNRFDDAKQIGADAAKSTKAFVALRSGPAPFAVVAFRGTDRDDKRDFYTDFDVDPQDRDGYTVHRGFAKALDQVWDDEVRPALEKFLGEHPNATVYFTGHSLGAALATIAVTRFQGAPCSLYTIGSPRAGDDRFVRAVLEKARVVVRFVNSQEIVTQVPPEILFKHYFRHAGLEKYIDRHGEIPEEVSEFDKWIDVGHGIAAHDGAAALTSIGHPLGYLKQVMQGGLADPPPYIVGNHTPARYAIHIWNHLDSLLA
jgi:triacylglycerol lipase